MQKMLYEIDKKDNHRIIKSDKPFNKPVLSVVMSVYNGEKYLRESVESILNQTFEDFEFIIIDDGSADNSFKIIEDYARSDKRIVAIKNLSNLGLSKSLNIALKNTKGDFIARMDADDISLPERLEKQVRFLKENPSYGLVGTAYIEINGNGKTIGNQRIRFLETDENIKKKIVGFNPFPHCAVMFRKEIQDSIGFYNEDFKYAQDYEFWIRIMTRYKVSNLPEALVYKRYSDNMISVNKEKAQRFYAIKAKIRAMRLLNMSFVKGVYLLSDLIFLMTPRPIINIVRAMKGQRNIFSQIWLLHF